MTIAMRLNGNCDEIKRKEIKPIRARKRLSNRVMVNLNTFYYFLLWEHFPRN